MGLLAGGACAVVVASALYQRGIPVYDGLSALVLVACYRVNQYCDSRTHRAVQHA